MLNSVFLCVRPFLPLVMRAPRWKALRELLCLRQGREAAQSLCVFPAERPDDVSVHGNLRELPLRSRSRRWSLLGWPCRRRREELTRESGVVVVSVSLSFHASILMCATAWPPHGLSHVTAPCLHRSCDARCSGHLFGPRHSVSHETLTPRDGAMSAPTILGVAALPVVRMARVVWPV